MIKKFTYVNVSWITGHKNSSMELTNAKHRSLSKPDLSWFFSCSDISNIVYLKFVRNRLAIWGHDWNTCARFPSVSSLPLSSNVFRFLIEHITLTNREVCEKSYFTTNCWLFCKYPCAASHSKMVKRLLSAGLIIFNDLHKNIINGINVASVLSRGLADCLIDRSGKYPFLVVPSPFTGSIKATNSGWRQKALLGLPLSSLAVVKFYISSSSSCLFTAPLTRFIPLQGSRCVFTETPNVIF